MCGCTYRVISVVLAVTEKEKDANFMDIAAWLHCGCRKGRRLDEADDVHVTLAGYEDGCD